MDKHDSYARIYVHIMYTEMLFSKNNKDSMSHEEVVCDTYHIEQPAILEESFSLLFVRTTIKNISYSTAVMYSVSLDLIDFKS